MIQAIIYNKLSKNDKFYSLYGIYHNNKKIFRSHSKNRLYKFISLINNSNKYQRKIFIQDKTV
jgi:hypothetical protein